MERLIERCAGLDVHRDSVAACVRVPAERGGRGQETRTFKTTTAGLLALHDWLASFGVTLVGMGSTGVQRTSRTKESISLLVEGRRGPGSFPVPVRTVGGHKLWRCGTLRRGSRRTRTRKRSSNTTPPSPVINGVLVARQSIPRLSGAERSAVRRLVRNAELVPA